MKKSSENRFIWKTICWTVSIVICLIAGLIAETGVRAIFANKDLADCYVPLGLALCMVLGLIGGVLLVRKRNADIKHKKEMKRLHPDEPWLWQSKWEGGKMTSSSKGTFIFLLVMFGGFSLIGWPGLYLCLPGIIKGNYVGLLSAIAPLIGLALGYSALCSLNRYRKFGESVFQMACMPGVVGGELAGVIHTKASQIPDGGFVLKLQAIRTTTSGSGKNSSTRQKIVWEDTHCVSVNLGASGGDGNVVLPVSFAIPFECQSSSETPTSNPRINWILSADAKFPGTDFHFEFDVPVFKTPESQENFQLSVAEQSFSEEIPLTNLCAASGVKQTNDNGGVSFEFPLARRFGAKIAFTLVTIIFSGGVFFMPVFFGILTLLMSVPTVRSWFWYGKISADENGVQVVTGFLGLRSHQFSRDQIKSLLYRDMTQTQEFDLLVETTEHEKPTLFGTALQGETAARRLCETLESALGMPNISKKVGRMDRMPEGLAGNATAGLGARNQTPHGA